MSLLHYKVTVEFDADASRPTDIETVLRCLRDVGEVTRVIATRKVVKEDK